MTGRNNESKDHGQMASPARLDQFGERKEEMRKSAERPRKEK